MIEVVSLAKWSLFLERLLLENVRALDKKQQMVNITPEIVLSAQHRVLARSGKALYGRMQLDVAEKRLMLARDSAEKARQDASEARRALGKIPGKKSVFGNEDNCGGFLVEESVAMLVGPGGYRELGSGYISCPV